MIYCKCKGRGAVGLTFRENEVGAVVLVVIVLLWKKVKASRGECFQFYMEGGHGVVGVRGQWMKVHRIGNSYLRLKATDLLY